MKAVAKFVRIAPRKARLVADEVRGKPVPEAVSILETGFCRQMVVDLPPLPAILVASASEPMRGRNSIKTDTFIASAKTAAPAHPRSATAFRISCSRI